MRQTNGIRLNEVVATKLLFVKNHINKRMKLERIFAKPF